jgi:hypothetical protein
MGLLRWWSDGIISACHGFGLMEEADEKMKIRDWIFLVCVEKRRKCCE